MKKRVGIWIRVSTEDQAKGESPEHHEQRARDGPADDRGEGAERREVRLGRASLRRDRDEVVDAAGQCARREILRQGSAIDQHEVVVGVGGGDDVLAGQLRHVRSPLPAAADHRDIDLVAGRDLAGGEGGAREGRGALTGGRA